MSWVLCRGDQHPAVWRSLHGQIAAPPAPRTKPHRSDAPTAATGRRCPTRFPGAPCSAAPSVQIDRTGVRTPLGGGVGGHHREPGDGPGQPGRSCFGGSCRCDFFGPSVIYGVIGRSRSRRESRWNDVDRRRPLESTCGPQTDRRIRVLRVFFGFLGCIFWPIHTSLLQCSPCAC